MAHLESVTTQKNISVKCKILLKNILSFLDKIFKIYVETTHCKCGVFLPKWDNKLYKLRSLINWSSLEEWLSANVDIKKFGRNRRCHRLLLGVTMLQAMYNLSDAATEEELIENVYWQYFCGWEYLQKDAEISEASIRWFRTILGEDGYNEILKELIRIGCKAGVVKKKT
ncbi:transposase [Candidatus Tisiphia endosymbiont of Parasteatoda lunata]|uniref:transposase n=1 Tax=Candidatus Tisiphia endosymbiont of Parasteatoda lunata TaxID=3066275 RepID=UPI00313AE268